MGWALGAAVAYGLGLWGGLPGPSSHGHVGSGFPGLPLTLRAEPSPRVRLPGATFVMGSNLESMLRAEQLCEREILSPLCIVGDEDEGGAPPTLAQRIQRFRREGLDHEVTLAPFSLDRTEVTVGAYHRCVAAGACGAPAFLAGDLRFDRPELPVVQVSWDDAVAFCGWVGGRLPTEAEWEYAARGVAGREFPWGSFYNPRLSNHGTFLGELLGDATDATDGFEGLAPVGAFPDGATPQGVLDLAGNAAEWVWDLFGVDEQGFGYKKRREQNPRGPLFGDRHVIRGGSYRTAAHEVRGAARTLREAPRTADVGFRCAYDTP